MAVWLGLALVLSFAGLPLAGALFPRLADRGASLALPIVLLVVFLVGNVVGRFSMAASLLATIAVLVGLVALAGRSGPEVDLRAHGEATVVFTAAFLFLVAARAVDPALLPTGGEKFLDFGMLKAILRAETVPPEDIWFAGEPVVYYYGGHLVAAQLTRAAGTAPAVAYNLALSVFFAAYVTAAYGLAGNVAARSGRFDRRAGALAAFFVGLASNLFTPLRLLLRPLPDGLAESIARTIGVWAGRFGPDRQGALITDRQPFSMWDATGVIDGTINEVPLFAFVNGDLHAHMMAPAFTLLLVGVLFAYTQTPAEERWRRLALLFGVVPAIGGTLAVVNTWSFPASAGLTFLAVLFDGESPRTLLPESVRDRLPAGSAVRTEVGQAAVALGAALGVGCLGVLWSLPFWLANAAGREVAFLPDRSSLAELLVVHGTFLLPIALYLGYLAWLRFELSRRQLAGVAVAVVAGIALSAGLDLAVVGLLVPVLLGGYLLGSRALAARRSPVDPDGGTDRPDPPGFELVVLLGAAGLVLVVEFVFLAGDAGPGRFNTVFKVYAQVWAFFAVGTAVALGRLLQLSTVARPVPRWPTILRAFVAALVVLASVYAALTLGVHFGNFVDSGDEATLDGTRYVERFHADEAAAIEWIDAREGTPTLVTAPGSAYDWSSAPSSFTGVPTVVGWQHHEQGFGRSADAVERRASHVDAIYTGNASTQRRHLERYDVRYVYVGPRERRLYDRITIDEHPDLTSVAEFEAVTIYEVGGTVRTEPGAVAPPTARK